ncbi:lipopolysaccharide biosynthesis protein [Flavimobilis marinus]|nr:hypothetical protein [Flavimobilis marinus]
MAAALSRYALQLATLTLVAGRFGVEMLGAYALAMAISGPIFVTLSLGLRNLYFTVEASTSRAAFTRIRLIAGLGGVALCLGLGAFLPEPGIQVLGLVSLAKYLEGVSDLRLAFLQREGSIRAIGLYALVQLLAAILLTAVAAIFSMGALQSIAVVLCGGTAMGLATAMWASRIQSSPSQPATRTEIRSLVHGGIPLGAAYGLANFTWAIPQYFLAAWSTPANVGRFAVALYIVIAVEFVVNAFQQAWLGTNGRSGPEGSKGGLALGCRLLLRWSGVALPIVALGIGFYGLGGPGLLNPSLRFTTIELAAVAGCALAVPGFYAIGAVLMRSRSYSAMPILNAIGLLGIIMACSLLVRHEPISGAFVGALLGLLVRLGLGLGLIARADTVGGQASPDVGDRHD